MHARLAARHGQHSSSFLVAAIRLGTLVLPAVLLFVGTLRSSGTGNVILSLGTLFQVMACVLAVATRPNWQQPIGSAVIMLYVIALSWLLLGGAGLDDWFLHLSQAILLVVPLGFFSLQSLRESGAMALRRARQLAAQLAHRREWPADPNACRALPEVKALRDALHVDASPALALLKHPKAQVRLAALAALEFRQNWRPGQPEAVLRVAQNVPEPEVRAAAVFALANIDDRMMIEALAAFLRDPSRLVRQAATEALLWNSEQRWSWIAASVRGALADPICQDDGPLTYEGRLLPPDAVGDLTAWAAEKGLLALRAAMTLGHHYTHALAAGPDPALIKELRRQLADVHAPAMLRLEIARLLHQNRELDQTVLHRLLEPSTPAPLRLIAVEALLGKGESIEAVAALRDLGRLPNREIALATAEVAQRRLGVELGLPRGQPLPPVQSRLAADVARRVLAWASQNEFHEEESAGVPLEEFE
jgi:hypothetical protein